MDRHFSVDSGLRRLIADATRRCGMTLREIDNAFGAIGVDSSWKADVEPTQYQRETRTLEWLEGIADHAPQEEVRFMGSFLEMLMDDPRLPDGVRRSLLLAMKSRTVETARLSPQSLTKSREASVPTIFIAHGASHFFFGLVDHLRTDWDVRPIYWESDSRESDLIPPTVEKMIEDCDIGIVVMTADDVLNDGTRQARLNVIHELGRLDGTLSSNRIVILQSTLIDTPPSNTSGIVTIRFNERQWDSPLFRLGRFLEREGCRRKSRDPS